MEKQGQNLSPAGAIVTRMEENVDKLVQQIVLFDEICILGLGLMTALFSMNLAYGKLFYNREHSIATASGKLLY